ncbi:MAG: vesicle-associated membrane protein 7 [Faunusvirus sp.]|jgi:hypothetical protein|uniref:Vesicle-associated membrane protein 7 n=1 Tax=Faunusvirus sp. TaxID=2487766 RepID=A0A3G4ZZ38_9VIRU|nr:MAG: vesicle-associated membrane protein 7 [Faunusvirus sp.]
MSGKPTDKLLQINQQTQAVVEIMHQNITNAIERGEKLEEIDFKAQQLTIDADQFRRSATNLRRHFCLKNAKMIGIIVAIAIVLLLILIAVICGNGACHR